MQTGKIERFPVIGMGQQYWNHLTEFIQKSLLAEKTISECDLKLLHLTDSTDEVIQIIHEHENGKNLNC